MELQINAPGGGYPIFIGPGLRHTLSSPGSVVVVSNTTVGPLYAESVAARLGAPLILLPDGEVHKTLNTVAGVYDRLVALGADRQTTLLSVGGGVLGDLTGFVAATYLRGLRWINLPTSLLAMVDASIGGKVGVDLPAGKNLVGAFKQPAQVWIDPEVLATLSEAEWRCGLAEVIKHGLLADPTLLEPQRFSREKAQELVFRALRVKQAVVEADPFEHGVRAHLNLGHTFGHALEQVSGYTLRHGEAVAIGLHAAALLSVRLGLAPESLVQQTLTPLLAAGLPTRFTATDPEAVLAAMTTDKKKARAQLRFVLLRALGDPLVTPAPLDMVRQVLAAVTAP